MTGNWNTWAMFRCCGVRPVTSTPSNFTVPRDGLMRPETMLSSVVLPHPDGPSSAYAPPSAKLMTSGSSA
jgi:hypothetical protein